MCAKGNVRCLPVDRLRRWRAGCFDSGIPRDCREPSSGVGACSWLTRGLRAAELCQIAVRGVTVAAGVSVCLQRRTIVFSEEQVLGAVRAQLPTGADIRIVDYCRLPVMSGRLRFEARPAGPPAGEDRQFYWKGAVIGDDRKSVPFWASVQVRIERRVVRAARLIPAKAILTKEDLTEEIEQSRLVEGGPTPDLSGGRQRNQSKNRPPPS